MLTSDNFNWREPGTWLSPVQFVGAPASWLSSPDLGRNSLTMYWVTDSHVLASSNDLLGRIAWFVDVCNAHQPDHVVHSGDFIDGESEIDTSIAAFMVEWGRLKTPSQHVLLGNRDLYDEGGVVRRNREAVWAEAFGIEGRDPWLESRFNQRFTLSRGAISIRNLVFDWLTPKDDALPVITSEVADCQETCLVIWTHDGSTWRETVEAAVLAANRPDLRVYHIFGHHHPLLPRMNLYNAVEPASRQNEGISYPGVPNLEGFLAPGLQDHTIARFQILSFFADGSLGYRTVYRTDRRPDQRQLTY